MQKKELCLYIIHKRNYSENVFLLLISLQVITKIISAGENKKALGVETGFSHVLS